MKKRTHVAVFDFDGTITPKDNSLFKTIDNSGMLSLEFLERAKRMRDFFLPRALSGELTFEEEKDWFFQTVDLYADSKLSLEQMGKILTNVRLREGVSLTLRLLKHWGIPVAIISYGFAEFIEIVLSHCKLNDYVSEVFSARLKTDACGFICGYHDKTVVLPANKGEFSRKFAARYAVPYKNILAVGDSGGDKRLGHLKENRLGIAQDEKEALKLKEFMGEVVVTETFWPVLNWLSEKLQGKKNLAEN